MDDWHKYNAKNDLQHPAPNKSEFAVYYRQTASEYEDKLKSAFYIDSNNLQKPLENSTTVFSQDNIKKLADNILEFERKSASYLAIIEQKDLNEKSKSYLDNYVEESVGKIVAIIEKNNVFLGNTPQKTDKIISDVNKQINSLISVLEQEIKKFGNQSLPSQDVENVSGTGKILERTRY